MENPFQQLVPNETPPQQEVQDEVMGSIHLKSYLANIAEFFMAIFGLTVRESLAAGPSPSVPEKDKAQPKGPKPHNPNKPDYFF